MNTVNRPFRKKDAMQLVTGQPVYMDDLVPADCLIVKLLRSPHANAIVKSIDTAVAKNCLLYTSTSGRRAPAPCRSPPVWPAGRFSRSRRGCSGSCAWAAW